ncbi:MAG TPA: hypothetical protein DDZ51_00395 [Planctomycetaceae bacterium]|nr:hypothetical protein [Planctomycetaceae bacterium]
MIKAFVSRVLKPKPKAVKDYVLKHPELLDSDALLSLAKSSDAIRNVFRTWMHNPADITTSRLSVSRIEEALETASKRYGHLNRCLITDSPLIAECFSKLSLTYEQYLRSPDDHQGVLVLAFESDEKLYTIMRIVHSQTNTIYIAPRIFYPTARYFHRNDLARQILLEEASCNPSKFALADYEVLIECIEITKSVSGAYVEIGVYQGRSARLALHYMAKAGIERDSFFLDTYTGFTYEGAGSSKDQYWAGSHTDTSIERVRRLLAPFDSRAKCVECDILQGEIPSMPDGIAVCNIDVDMYEAVRVAAERISPLVNKNGVLIFEDQGHTPALAGGWLAAKEFLDSSEGKLYIPIHKDSGQMLLIKK